MADYLNSNFVDERKVYIGDIPAILIRPKDFKEKIPTIIFYHGWSSNKESQRLRGLIFASVGFQVLIPDAINHGERKPIDYTMDNINYLWETIFNNLDEAKLLIDEIINKYNGDPRNISVTGHSMGGITAAGVFTYNSNLNSLVVLNGVCAWRHMSDFISEKWDLELTEDLRLIGEKIDKLDPYNHLDKLLDRPILMLNGEDDNMVPIESQRFFLRELRPRYKDKEKIDVIGYKYLNHFITTNMMEDSIKWFKKYKID